MVLKVPLLLPHKYLVHGWYDIIGEKTIADAVSDRLIHQSHGIELHVEEMRKKEYQ